MASRLQTIPSKISDTSTENPDKYTAAAYEIQANKASLSNTS